MKKPQIEPGVGERLDTIFGEGHSKWHEREGVWVRTRCLKLPGIVWVENISADVEMVDTIQDARFLACFGAKLSKKPRSDRWFLGRSLSIATYKPETGEWLNNKHQGAMNGTYDLDVRSGELSEGVVKLESNYVDNREELPVYLDVVEAARGIKPLIAN